MCPSLLSHIYLDLIFILLGNENEIIPVQGVLSICIILCFAYLDPPFSSDHSWDISSLENPLWPPNQRTLPCIRILLFFYSSDTVNNYIFICLFTHFCLPTLYMIIYFINIDQVFTYCLARYRCYKYIYLAYEWIQQIVNVIFLPHLLW